VNEDRLLLCTDGLTEMVDEEEIAGVLMRDQPAQDACQTLVDLALEHGGVDNGNKHMTKRISTAVALIFVFTLGQFALAVNANAHTIAATASAQENQNRREDRRDRNQYRRRRHRRHRRNRGRRQDRREDRRDNRNSNRPPS
jgi:hypothetical protein